jgi:pentatricopeptide repeat protein
MNESAELNYQRAEQLIEIKRFNDALALVKKCLAADPQNYWYLCLYSQCHYHLMIYKTALEQVEKAISIQPDDEWGHRIRSLCLSRMFDFRGALAAAQEAVRLEPESHACLNTLINAYLDLGMLSEALETSEKMRALYPENYRVYVHLGFIYLTRERLKLAERNFKEALRLNPQCVEALNNLAVIYEKKGLKEEASEYYQLSIKGAPEQEKFLKNLTNLVRADPSLSNLSPGVKQHLLSREDKAEPDEADGDEKDSSVNLLLYLVLIIAAIRILLYIFSK